jgi:aminoglycoside phosphotransferase family enzyme/predicted kinase
MELPQLIEALSRPSAYPHPVETVEVRQTHISVVFLAGTLAYKVKKPVSLGFVDYATLDRRRYFCEAEVRLNRRLAPDVYLDVVPVTLASGSPILEGSGPAIEWAVKMARLPDEATLRSYLERGAVGPRALATLAGRLARFYRDADAARKIADAASFDAVARNARENWDQANAQIGSAMSRPVFDRLQARTDQALLALHPVISDRAARGVPRDTHGDLRLGHVYWFPDRDPGGQWVIVDCIEFDDRYRYADPIADVAFLTMELKMAGRGDLARSFTESYLEMAGDGEGRSLLPFYQSYRSAVRGKVLGLKSAAAEVPPPERALALARARAHWIHALCELEPANEKPCLVLVAGLPGTGKSSLALALSQRAGFTVIRSDLVRKELDGRGDRHPTSAEFGQGLYSPEWDRLVYEECARRAEMLVFEGRRVLVDATFREEARRRLLFDLATRWAIPICLLLCHAEPAVARSRLSKRRGDVSDADHTIYDEIASRWEEAGPRTQALSRTVETGGSPADAIQNALDVLREFGLRDG